MLPYGRQSIDAADVAAAAEALQSGWLTTGPKIREFEEAVAERVGARHAVVVSNGTAALHLAMLVAGVRSGDRVVTSSNTFLASANCAAFVGAVPDFCDIDPVSYNLCPEQLERGWQDDTKAVVAVHYAGQTADMPAIADVARRRGAVVVEDACHAIGGQFVHDGQIHDVGGHEWADISVFSFHPVKSLTTGEGGMLLTDDPEYAKRARLLRTHGMIREQDAFVGLGDPAFDERGPWYYEMQEPGLNYRITDVQCGLGLSQLNRLEQFVERRRKIVARYNEAFSSLDAVQIPRLRCPDDRELTSWHLYTLQIDFRAIGVTRTEFMQSLRERGVGSQVLYIPVHLQPWYRRTCGYEAGKCPVAEQFYLRALSLPLFPEMSDADVETVICAVSDLVVSS